MASPKENKKSKSEIDSTKQKLIHDHAWKHFELNAKQRVDLFKYYILFLSLFAGVLHVNEFKELKPISTDFLGIILPLLFFYITGIFHLVENRNRQLVGKAKNALIEFEEKYINEGDKYSIFKQDKDCNHGLRHSQCYLGIFILGYAISALLLVFNLCKIFCRMQ